MYLGRVDGLTMRRRKDKVTKKTTTWVIGSEMSVPVEHKMQERKCNGTGRQRPKYLRL